MRLLLVIFLLVIPLGQVVAESFDSSKRVGYISEGCESGYNNFLQGTYPMWNS